VQLAKDSVPDFIAITKWDHDYSSSIFFSAPDLYNCPQVLTYVACDSHHPNLNP